MLKKKQRLSRKEFADLLKKGRRVHGTHFTLVYAPSVETKCGLVVSKKVAKNATARNLLRRRIYAIFGENLAQLSRKHVAVLTRSGIQNLSFKELQKILEDGLRKFV